MVDASSTQVPVWALAADEGTVPAFADAGPMTPERLGELRTVLASLAGTPIATLEVHPLPSGVDRSHGILLGSSSPLARHLSDLINQTPDAGAATTGEALYRMVVPTKVAKKLGSGLLQPMLSRSVPDGIHSALMDSSGITGQAAFVPVAARGASMLAGGGALTVAPALIMLAVAAGLSMQIESAREQISELLEKQNQDSLDSERNSLDGCRNPIEKATAILLDEGSIGQAIGLAAKVGAIEDAIAAARRRVTRWEASLAGFPEGPVELSTIKKAFPGIGSADGEFHAHLELAALAIELKRRVNVLQAVEQAQINPANPFERFVRQLSANELSVDELEGRIVAVDRSHGTFDFVFTLGEVDDLLRLSRELRKLGGLIQAGTERSDMAVEMVRNGDGSVVVLPAHTVR